MKTLYINISGENIQSMDDVVVVGKPADDLAYKFYFELGYQILKGVIAPSVKNKRELITEFIQQHKDVYEEKILPQLEQAKRLMLSNDFRGDVKVQLPQEYIQWLNYYGTADYSAIAKSLNERGGIVTINLERIYRNGIQLLINSIEPDDYGQLVVNDDAVEDDTEMVVAIRERLKNPMLPLTSYSEFVKKKEACPKCGKNLCECEEIALKSDELFPVFGVTLGQTSVYDINSNHLVMDIGFNRVLYLRKGVGLFQSDDYDAITSISISKTGGAKKLPEKWERFFDFSLGSLERDVKEQIRNISRYQLLTIKYESETWIISLVKSDYLVKLEFINGLLDGITIFLSKCPNCGEVSDVNMEFSEEDSLTFTCEKCWRSWGDCQ